MPPTNHTATQAATCTPLPMERRGRSPLTASTIHGHDRSRNETRSWNHPRLLTENLSGKDLEVSGPTVPSLRFRNFANTTLGSSAWHADRVLGQSGRAFRIAVTLRLVLSGEARLRMPLGIALNGPI